MATVEEVQFKNKYHSLKNEIKSSQKELNNLLNYGGGQYLEETENKKKIEEKIQENGLNAYYNSYEENLTAKKELLQMKVEMITNKKSLSELVVDSVNQQNAEIEKSNAEAKSKNEEFNEIVYGYNEEYCKIYDEGIDFEDSLERLSSFHEWNMNELAKELSVCQENKAKATDNKEIKQYEDKIVFIKKCQKAAPISYKSVVNKANEENEIKKKTEAKILNICKKAAKEEVDDADRIASLTRLKSFDKINKTIAKLPQEIIDQFNQINAILHQLINGFALELPGIDTGSATSSIDDLIVKIMKYLNPVTGIFKGLPLPPVPFLSPVIDVIGLVSQVDSPNPNMTEEQKKKLEELKKSIEVPSAWKQSADIFINTINTVMMLMPTLLIQLIFMMLDTIVGLFNQIAGVIGVPGIPYPLSLIPDCISLMPKLTELMKILPSALRKMIEDKMKSLAAQMMVCGEGIGDAFSKICNLTISKPKIQCPEAIKNKFKANYEAKKAQTELRRAEELKKQIDKMNKDQPMTDSELLKYQFQSMENTANSIKSISDLEYGENSKLIKELQDQAKAIRPNFAEPTTSNNNTTIDSLTPG